MCLRRRQQQKVEEVEEVSVLWSAGQRLGNFINFINFTLYSARLCYATSENAKHTCLQEGV